LNDRGEGRQYGIAREAREGEEWYPTEGIVYRVATQQAVPIPVIGQEAERYRQKKTQADATARVLSELGNSVGEVPQEINSSKSNGAQALKTWFAQTTEIRITRVTSSEEAEAIRVAGGNFIPKPSGSKWFSFGEVANINSSGDKAHSVKIQWTISENLKKALLLPIVNNYNESEITADKYKEPYWTWKDNEVNNISLSPGMVPVFNSMIIAVTVDGKKVK
jgi:hypothetical protein